MVYFGVIDVWLDLLECKLHYIPVVYYRGFTNSTKNVNTKLTPVIYSHSRGRITPSYSRINRELWRKVLAVDTFIHESISKDYTIKKSRAE